MQPEAWLRGPIEGIASELMPVAHSLIQAGEEIERALDGLTTREIWERPGGAASVGYHVRHLAGSLDRLFTYAMGGALSEAQLKAIAAEKEPGQPPAEAGTLLAAARSALDDALSRLRDVDPTTLLEPREVGRQRLPSNVIGLLFHAAEHATRHAGQALTTAMIVRGLRTGAAASR